jgi:hypothetical protein
LPKITPRRVSLGSLHPSLALLRRRIGGREQTGVGGILVQARFEISKLITFLFARFGVDAPWQFADVMGGLADSVKHQGSHPTG